jgi:hypothetical protein
MDFAPQSASDVQNPAVWKKIDAGHVIEAIAAQE